MVPPSDAFEAGETPFIGRELGQSQYVAQWGVSLVNCRAGTPSCSGRDLRLEAEDVAVFYAGGHERVGVEELAAGALVMELIAHELAVGTVTWQIELFNEHRDEAVHLGIDRHFDELSLVAGRVPNFDFDVAHSVPRKTSNRAISERRAMQAAVEINAA